MCKIQRTILALVFLTSGGLKIFFPSDHNLLSRGLGSHSLADVAGIAIAVAEFGLASVLATRWWKTGVRLSVVFMVTSFLVSALMSLSGLPPAQNCGCFGALRLTDAVHWGVILGTSLVATSSIIIIDNAKESG